ncbi:MAG: hypothetical protein KDK70_14065 [Myxococcales bacterium]|nr:hypothetical protein [Myxococcales bacterium]
MLGAMSRRPSRLLGLALAAGLALATSPALAAGFPDFDAKREQILFGRVRPSDAAVPGKAETFGTFDDAGGTLQRAPGQAEPSTFWMAKGDAATIADGMVRFALVPGKRADMGLMVRAHAQAGWSSICGYEVTFEKNKVRLLRWDRGVAKPMGETETLARVGPTTSVEVVVYVVGPQIVATVYSSQKLEHLATLAAHDTTYADGRVGLRVGKLQEGGGLTLAAVMDTRRAARSGVGQRVPYGQLYAPSRAKDTTPFGPNRYAYVPKAQVGRLPEALRRKATGEHTPAGGEPQAVLAISPVEAELLRRTDVDVLRIDGTAAWGAFDAPYRAHKDAPPVPTKRGFALDRSYKNPRMVEDLLRAYHAKYPEITELTELGRSHGGRPIWALKISDNPKVAEDEPAVLFDATHHASELLATEFGLDVVAGLLEDYGRERRVTQWVDGMEIFCVPMVNPDGNHYFLETSMWMIRKNGLDVDRDGALDPFEGVDLNRNYPFGWGQEGGEPWFTSQHYRGPGAGSEPETKAMMALAEQQRFAAAISFHTIGRSIFVPYTVDASRSPDPNAAWTVAEEVAAAAPAQRRGKPYVVRPNGYPVAGSDQDWLMFEHGTVALLLEGPYHNPELPVRTETVANTRPVWQALLDRVADGPRISGHVRDEAGRPLEAEVVIDEVELRAGERWTSRPRDGRFDRLLARGGRYTVRAKAPGRRTVSQEVRVRDKPAVVDLVLPKA